MVDEQNMKTEHWRNESNRKKTEDLRKRQRLASTCLFVPNSLKYNKISDKDRHFSETEFLVVVTIVMTTLHNMTPFNPPW